MIYEIVVDSNETPNKCTIIPLASRADFRIFRKLDTNSIGPLSAPLLLHHEGQCLTVLRDQFKSAPALASIDCVWRRLPKLLSSIQWANQKPPALAKIPEGFKTAYPRVSRSNMDPSGGLATIEAIFIASALLGYWDATLFSKYYFGRKFIELNAQQFIEFGIHEVLTPNQFPLVGPTARDSLSRRRSRGRI